MKLFFRRYGQGFPVIILHGLFGMSDNWVTLARQLAEKNEIFLPDLRNHGQSPHSRVFDFPSMTEDLAEFIEDNGIPEFHLLGHSLGGKVAMIFSGRYPFRIRKLVIVDIGLRAYSGNRDHQLILDTMASTDLTAAGSRSAVERQIETALPDPRLRQILLKNIYWKEGHHLSWRLNLKSVNENLLQLFEGIRMDEPFGKPALFIRGERSGYITTADLDEIGMKFPGFLLRTIPGAGHWVHADEPGEFLRIVREFLDP